MRSLILILSSTAMMACASNEKKEVTAAETPKEPAKGVDVDRIECSWNKTTKEADEKCKPDPTKPTIGQKMDQQLNKDAKTLKKFFGVKGKEEAPKGEAKAPIEPAKK